MILPSPLKFCAALWRVFAALLRRETMFSPDWLVKGRERICLSRSGDCYWPKSGQCRKCSCFIKLKTRLSTEECPRKFW
jgi:hypothetical protein